MDVAVVGAGLAGLAAASVARAGGASTVVLEAHGPGGRARTWRRQGFSFNLGPHALYVRGAGRQVLDQLGVHPAGSSPPLARYRVTGGGRRPLAVTGPRSLLATTSLSARSKVRLGRLWGGLARLDPAAVAGQSLRTWLDGRELAPDARAMVLALVRLGTYCGRPEELSADAALAQLQLATGGVLYLDGGWSGLVEALAGPLEVRTHHRLVALEQAAGRTVLALEADGGVDRVRARAVVLALGTPRATRALLGSDPGWGELAPPVTAACLDVAATAAPEPGYLLGLDQPLYGTTQGPPARLAPPGHAAVAVIRYGARAPEVDRTDLVAFRRQLGVPDDRVVFERFLASVVVAGSMPTAAGGGLPGRPGVGATGLPGVLMAGDWVGPVGLLADAALASGRQAAEAALAVVRGR